MFKIIILLLLISLSLISDIKTYKIKNKIVLTFMILGMGANVVTDGIKGIKVSLLGLITPILILFILYALRMLGAGDIKLFSAIGSIMGVKFAIYSMAFSFLSGGIIAIIILVLRKNGVERLRYLWLYMKNTFLSMSIQPYTEFEDKRDTGKFRFAYAIFVGTVLALFV